MERNEVLISNDGADRPRRSLTLESIATAELRSLAPTRSEMAGIGGDRTAALLAYSDRLRENYRANENGFRDGMRMLAESVGDGQALVIACSCRNGAFCHADVVRMAVEKVGARLKEREPVSGRTIDLGKQPGPNVRTQRAIAEILSYTNNDRLLSRIDHTDGRTRPGHASYLNKISQFARDDFERGAISRNGIAIIPNEQAERTPPLNIVSQEYAVEKLSKILGDVSRARDLAPKIVEAGEKIVGSSSDRETQLKVFSSIYDALDGRGDFVEEPTLEALTKEERFERNLQSISRVAEEMSKLEPAEQVLLLDDRNDQTQTFAGYDRIEVREPEISKLISELPASERDRWFDGKFSEIDRQLESGKDRQTIIAKYREIAHSTARHDPANWPEAVNDTKIATAYIGHQMSHPETRLRNQNERYRKFAVLLESAGSREEVTATASGVRAENARANPAASPRPLTKKEMQYLFTELSPAHYSTDMTAARLSFAHSAEGRAQVTKALLRGDIRPSPEATRLIEGLEDRLNRRDIKDAVAATRHFLESLKTRNDELRSKNAFDHNDLYRKLPPQERDFVYQRATDQHDRLAARLGELQGDRPSVDLRVEELRKSVASELTQILRSDHTQSGEKLAEKTKEVLAKAIEGSERGKSNLAELSKRIGESINNKMRTAERSDRADAGLSDRVTRNDPRDFERNR